MLNKDFSTDTKMVAQRIYNNCTWETMKAEDVQRTVGMAMTKANLAKHQQPKLLSDNGSCYIAT